MTYQRFEDLPVWQEAIRLAHGVYDLTETCKMSYSLRDQLERSSLSVSNNIAEGFERGTTAELLQFIYIARGSAGEARSQLHFLAGRPGMARHKAELGRVKAFAESCSRQLRAWAESLQDSEIRGQRHLNSKAKNQVEQQKRYDAFRKKLRDMLPANHPLKRQGGQ